MFVPQESFCVMKKCLYCEKVFVPLESVCVVRKVFVPLEKVCVVNSVCGARKCLSR